MRVTPLLVVAFVACRTEGGVDTTTITSAPVAAPERTMPDLVELDYRGRFHGANVYVTFGSRGRVASGSCFYEADGADVPLRGGLDERGVLTLEEMGEDGPVSNVTLTKDAGGAWSGTWESADASRSGAAELEPIARRSGQPVLVAARHTKPRDAVDVRTPVVLGLADRAFERKLNAALAEMTDVIAPRGASAAVTVDYGVPLDERGFVSFVMTSRYASELPCGGGLCIGDTRGLTAAVDARAIADDVWDVVDPVKARPLVASRKLGPVGVLTRRGVSFRIDELEEGVRAPLWDEIPYDELGASLRRSPFEMLWKRR
jgi:hypothetical protein